MAPGPYTQDEVRRGLRLGVAEGAFAFATFTLTSGAILAALVLSVGMGDAEYGLLAAMPFLAQFLQFPNVLLMRRFQDRRALTILFATAGRLCLLGVAAAMLWLPREALPAAIIASFIGWSAFGGVASGAWLWWMRDLVPSTRFGSYFGNRAAVLLACSAPVLLLAGLFIDLTGARESQAQARQAFAVIYGAAAACGLASSVLLTRIPHRRPADNPKDMPVARSLSVPFRDANYRRALAWLVMWGFGATVSVPFFAVFLLVDVGLPVSWVTALLVVGIGTNVLFFRLWGVLSDSHGNKPVLAVCVPVLAGALLLGAALPAAATPGAIVGAIMVQVLIAIATAGADLTAWNLAFKLSEGPATASYLALQSAVRAAATGTGPVVGGVIALSVGGGHLGLSDPGGWLHISHIQVTFLVGAACVLASALPLARVVERGEASRSELVLALRKAAASDTLLPGVRHFAMASSEAVRYIVLADQRARSRLKGNRRAPPPVSGGGAADDAEGDAPAGTGGPAGNKD
jgi:MFS family permease